MTGGRSETSWVLGETAFDVPEACDVHLQIHSVDGRFVTTLVDRTSTDAYDVGGS